MASNISNTFYDFFIILKYNEKNKNLMKKI